MAERRYYWLKLKEDFFRQKAMKKLRRMDHGETYTIIYLKIQLESLRSDGVIAFDGLEDSFAEELALQIDERAEDVTATVDFLTKHGLIVQLSETESYLPQAVENTGSEGSSAQRARVLRKRKALQCNGDALHRHGEIERRDREDIDIEIEQEKSEREEGPTARIFADEPCAVFKKPTSEEVKAYCVENEYRMNPFSFCDYYEANGWMTGKGPMRDWRAAVRRWEARELPGTRARPATDYENGDDFRNG